MKSKCKVVLTSQRCGSGKSRVHGGHGTCRSCYCRDRGGWKWELKVCIQLDWISSSCQFQHPDTQASLTGHVNFLHCVEKRTWRGPGKDHSDTLVRVREDSENTPRAYRSPGSALHLLFRKARWQTMPSARARSKQKPPNSSIFRERRELYHKNGVLFLKRNVKNILGWKI